jgi:hypothetical protein
MPLHLSFFPDRLYGILPERGNGLPIAIDCVVGRIMKAAAAPVGTSRMCTLVLGHHEDRTLTNGYAPTREAAMAAFAKSWRRD